MLRRTHYKTNVAAHVFPLSAEDFFSGRYSQVLAVQGLGFDAIYLDFCGQFGQLKRMEGVFAHLKRNDCLFGVTLQKRAMKECLRKAKAWIEQRAAAARFLFKLTLCHEYHNMFTLFYELTPQ